MVAIHRLTPRKVQTAKPGKHEDGGGLRLVVGESGSKKWVLRFSLNGKRREMGLGSFPSVGLGDARAIAAEYRKQALDGIDPIKARAVEAEVIPTFTSCAATYIRAHRRGWKNYKHQRQWVSTLRRYACPVIGDKSVDEISTEDILKILKPIWNTTNETAKRVQGRIENVLDYASARRWRDASNPARWRGHLSMLLPKPSKIQKVRHHPAMPYDQVPAFMDELRYKDSSSSYALRFLILTATRTSEVIGATWDEVDLDKQVWTIPEERMKAGREHRVPLTSEMLSILYEVPRIVGNPFVFPGGRAGKGLSIHALLMIMRKMGYGVGGDRGDYVPHGFRSSFRDWSGEVSSHPRDVAEMALAHTIQNKVEAAYRRGDLFEKRRAMMNDWGAYLSTTDK
jgi:integrase